MAKNKKERKTKVKLVSGLRNKAALIMFLVLVAFVLLIVLQWGADILGIKRWKGRTPNVLAKVGDREVTVALFQRYLQDELRNVPKEELDERKYEELKEKAWNNMVKDIVLEKVAEKEKTTVTEDELFEVIKTNPPQDIRNMKELQTPDGKFDYQKYLQILANPQNLSFIMRFAEKLKYPLLQEKLRQDVWNSYRITTLEYKDMYEKYNNDVFLEALFVTRLGDRKMDTTITEEELKRYYNEHKNDFKIKERVKTAKVFFPVFPSAKDTISAKETAEDVYSQIVEGADFFDIGRMYSHRKLDTLKTSVKILPQFLKSLFSQLKKGGVSSPFLYRNAWRIIKLFHRKRDTVYYAQIVIYIRPSPDTRREVIEKITQFGEEWKKSKSDLKNLVQKYRAKLVDDFIITKEREIFGFKGYQKAIKTWAFSAKKNEVSPPFPEGRRGYSIFIVKERLPETVAPFEEVKKKIKMEILTQRKKQILQKMAQDIKQLLLAGKSLKEIHDEKYPFLRYDTLNFPHFWLASGTYGPEFAGIIFALKEGESYGPIERPLGFMFVKCTKIGFNNISPQKIINDRITYAVTVLANEVFKTPEIKDYRNALNY